LIFITIYQYFLKRKIIEILPLSGEARKFLSFRTQAQKIKVEIIYFYLRAHTIYFIMRM